MLKPKSLLCFSLFFFLLVSSPNVDFTTASQSKHKVNPFTPRAYLVRYWNKQVSKSSTKSPFLLSTASPLTVVETARFAKLAEQNALSKSLSSFCSYAHLFCFPDLSMKQISDPKFLDYTNKTFANYGTGKIGGANLFTNYLQSQNTDENDNLPFDSFT